MIPGLLIWRSRLGNSSVSACTVKQPLKHPCASMAGFPKDMRFVLFCLPTTIPLLTQYVCKPYSCFCIPSWVSQNSITWSAHNRCVIIVSDITTPYSRLRYTPRSAMYLRNRNSRVIPPWLMLNFAVHFNQKLVLLQKYRSVSSNEWMASLFKIVSRCANGAYIPLYTSVRLKTTFSDSIFIVPVTMSLWLSFC